MMNKHVHDNRILLAVGCGMLFVTAIIISAKVLTMRREAPLLMSVMETSAHETSEWRPAEAVSANIEPASLVLDVTPSASAEHDDIRWFNGRPVRPARTISMLVTAYSPDERSCGGSDDGITASGYSVWTNGMKLVAADTSLLPFGSLVSVPGYGEEEGEIVPVLDRGGKIKGHRLDVLYATHERARQWGAQRLEVIVWEYADGLPSGFRTQHN